MDTTSVLGFCDLQAIREYIEKEPLVQDIWKRIIEISDSKNIMLGRLHENHLLGIFIWFYTIKQEEITTEKLEAEYSKFFKKVSRSTISTYLNQLEKQGILSKRKQGKEVFYKLTYEPPNKIHPIYLVRNFCPYPSYTPKKFFRLYRIQNSRFKD